MEFDQNFEHSISLEQASAMTARFRQARGGNETLAVAFGSKAISDILNHDGCKGIRAYFAKSADDKLTLVIVGVDERGDDLPQGGVKELGHLCPPFCGIANSLNGLQA